MEITIGNNIKALIFDVDGTLADSMPVHLESWKVIGNKYGFQYSREYLERYAGMSGQEIVEIINENNGLQLNPDQIAHEKEEAFLENLDQVEPIIPVVKLLEDYHGRLPIAAGTGGFRRVATRILKAIGVWDKIDVLVGSDDVIHHKPAPDTFLKCAAELGVEPADCLVFEDADLGFRAARKAGMHLMDVRPYYMDDYEIEAVKGSSVR
ncbi:MAG: beta-phosphoglucomutase family hydrolase [Bacteroidales bacterium]|nr:beta-phosphoglucomutase family hydrolase [Bacteroidales bacterium]